MKTHGDPRAEKREAFKAAARLLEKQDDASLRYAAFELRRCLEAFIYEKLLIYGELLPERSVHTWQSDKAFDALLEIDPLAEETMTLAVAVQVDPQTPAPGPYKEIGTDQRPKLKWVKKTWNKLGSYLHADWPFERSPKSTSSLRSFLEEAIRMMEPLVTNSFNMASISPVIIFQCEECGSDVRSAALSVEVRRAAVCLTCGRRYVATKVDDVFRFLPDGPFITCECGVETYIRKEDIKGGYRVSCRGCKATMEFIEPQWQCRVVAVEGRGGRRDAGRATALAAAGSKSDE